MHRVSVLLCGVGGSVVQNAAGVVNACVTLNASSDESPCRVTSVQKLVSTSQTQWVEQPPQTTQDATRDLVRLGLLTGRWRLRRTECVKRRVPLQVNGEFEQTARNPRHATQT